MNRVRVLYIVMPVTYVLVVTLLSIVNSDASDIGFGGYIESCQSIVYSDASDIGVGGYNESCQSIAYSDACDIGFGGYIVEYCI